MWFLYTICITRSEVKVASEIRGGSRDTSNNCVGEQKAKK